MPQQVSLVQDGLDRFTSAFDSLGGEVQRIQKRVRAQRKSFEKRFNDQRETFEKRTRTQVNRIESELRKSGVLKRAQTLRKDAAKQLQNGMNRVLGALPVATKTDVKRIERKLGQISRKVKALEDTRKANGKGSPL
ncbi:MAG: hypothetical protein IH884_11335 [Myxococcales bacterium]|nr:hypothetical protein [Myxococcales bacterium]